MTIKQDLQAARALIALPEKWTQGSSARDKSGVIVSPLYSNAECFCASGAVINITGYDGMRMYNCCSALYKQVVSPYSDIVYDIVSFNDHPNTTHQQVLEVFDRAIAQEPT